MSEDRPLNEKERAVLARRKETDKIRARCQYFSAKSRLCWWDLKPCRIQKHPERCSNFCNDGTGVPPPATGKSYGEWEKRMGRWQGRAEEVKCQHEWCNDYSHECPIGESGFKCRRCGLVWK